jgi:hypothetical protein
MNVIILLMTDTLRLTADHVTYSVCQQQNEYTNLRLWAIQKQYPTNEAEYNAANQLALYWYYNNKLQCKYNAAVQRKINAINLVF